MSRDIVVAPSVGTTFSYDDMGEGNIPIIFIHGFPFNKSTWEPQMDYFKTTHRVIAYDIRGFGKSFDDTNDFSIDLFSDDLIQLMDSLQIDKATVCGLSMGGFIALNAINRFPERFEALILCDTQCISDTEDVKANRYSIIKEIRAVGKGEFTETFIHKIFHKDSFEEKKDQVELIHDIIRANSQHAIIRGLEALAERAETCSTLATISVPTLIICGREDVVTPLAQSEVLHQQIKNSTLKVIDHAGHVSNIEQPGVFNGYMADFLKTL